MKRIVLTGFVFFTIVMAQASTDFSIGRIDPPNWWVGMKDSSLQLCIYAKNIAAWQVSTTYTGVKIKKVNRVENPNYLFVDLSISSKAKPGKLTLIFAAGKEKKHFEYSLEARNASADRYSGFDSRDLIYMLMPDRFANGDPADDVIRTTRQKSENRDSMFERHGGDLKGVIDHLDYIKQLGATALWLTPVQENDQPIASYHGYGFTDHYKVDPRLGDNQLYTDVVNKAHIKGLKIIMDMVYNHVGDQHWFYRDAPSKDWFHRNDSFVQTNYRLTALMDPYASEYDKKKMSDGWFVKQMPDLNQQNPFVAQYLIQNSVWWIETTGIDGYRMDTYAYSDLRFMGRLLQTLKSEYPKFNAIGEVWDHAVPFQAYLTQHSKIKGAPETNLSGVTDFQLYFAINDALNKPMDWTDGLSEIYYTLAQDFLYFNASGNLIFLDNHDLSRFYSVIGEDIRKFKMGLGFLLTTRGIPCLYYGTEIAMKNFADPDGMVRSDFPGGWPGDKQNKFQHAGRTALENEAYDYLTRVANYRRSSEALQTGKLTQFVPEKDTYVYFRSNENSVMMIIMYCGKERRDLPLERYKEMFRRYSKGVEVTGDGDIDLNSFIALDPYSIKIYQLQ